MPRARKFALDRIPTIEEIRRLCEYPDRRIKAIIYTMASSGIRVGASAAEEDSLMVVVSALAAEDCSAMNSINISYKQSTKSIVVTATATTNNHGTKTTNKKRNRQYVSIQQPTLLEPVSADSVSVDLTVENEN
jgi:hypothetical protein